MKNTIRAEKDRQREIAERGGVRDVTPLDVDAALIGVRHAIEAAEVAFSIGGAPGSVEQERALRRLALARFEYEHTAARLKDQEDATRRAADDRLARSNNRTAVAQLVLAAAITAATCLQAWAAWQTVQASRETVAPTAPVTPNQAAPPAASSAR